MSNSTKKGGLLVDRILVNYIDFIRSIFGSQPFELLVYGSFSYRKCSDLDICTIVKDYDEKQKNIIAKYTIDLHKKYKLRLDWDVPYYQKTLFSFRDLECAVGAAPFKSNGIFFNVDPIIANQEYLASDKMKHRLALNILTTKTETICGGLKETQEYKKRAWETLIGVILTHNHNHPVDANVILKNLYRDPVSKKTYKQFLGYDLRNQQVKKHLSNKLHGVLNRLVSENMLILNEGKISCTYRFMRNLSHNYERHKGIYGKCN